MDPDYPIFLQQPEFQAFKRAFSERKAPLVLVTGAGLSADAELPSWSKLQKILIEECQKREATLNQFGQAIYGPKFSALAKQENPWVLFKLIKEILTPPVFDELIERNLTPSDDADIPSSYMELLKLQPRGVVTLNLDKFSGEALAKVKPGELITPIFGMELARKWRALQSSKTYLVYLHGALHDPSTWVLTQDELSRLLNDPGHSHFLKTIYTDSIVLFAGVGADDLALSSRLLELTTADFRPRSLYWLTTRGDEHAAKWAAKNYVSMIRYPAKTAAKHSEFIRLLVSECVKYVPQEDPQPPLVDASARFIEEDVGHLDPELLAQRPPESIRRAIAARLERILLDETEEKDVYERYREFCEKYGFAVHRAFYRSKHDRFREWFGYKLNFPSLGRGNFGEVYSAEAIDGKIVAVKIMHDSIFGNNDMLGGFRRGVRSMGIVSQQNIDGMVRLIESFEVPPTIVMPYVEGVSLQEALESRADLPWLVRLDIAIKIGSIVAAGHALPQTVMHRDLKPSNIMIKNFEYTGSFDPEVVVLDFDMSWHKGSRERDVVFESRDDFGFLAPEQTDPSSRYPARSTRVDSYGYGMTIYFMFGRQAPRPNEALSDQWPDRAARAAESGYNQRWKSAPARLGRLIARATAIEQSLRADFASIVNSLRFLRTACTDPAELDSPEIWAEELLCRCTKKTSYMWDDATGRGGVSSANGVVTEFQGNFRNNSVNLILRYIDRGVADRSKIIRLLPNLVTNSKKLLSEANWRVTESRANGMEANLSAEIEVESLRANSEMHFKAASAVYKEFEI